MRKIWMAALLMLTIWNLPVAARAAETQEMYRLYNAQSGEHFYTASALERDTLVSWGWVGEGVAWTAPAGSDTPVYRLLNPSSGDHHYTTNAGERDALIAAGWTDEGIGWYSDDAEAVPLYRLYNPNAPSGSHHYTTSAEERDSLIAAGWTDEGIGWYGADSSGEYYILNTRSRVIHRPDCGQTNRMSEKNKKISYQTLEELLAQGYTRCGDEKW